MSAAIERDYKWPPVARVEDWARARIDENGGPWIDGRRVTVAQHMEFMAEWGAFYDANLRAAPAVPTPKDAEPS